MRELRNSRAKNWIQKTCSYKIGFMDQDFFFCNDSRWEIRVSFLETVGHRAQSMTEILSNFMLLQNQASWNSPIPILYHILKNIDKCGSFPIASWVNKLQFNCGPFTIRWGNFNYTLKKKISNRRKPIKSSARTLGMVLMHIRRCTLILNKWTLGKFLFKLFIFNKFVR